MWMSTLALSISFNKKHSYSLSFRKRLSTLHNQTSYPYTHLYTSKTYPTPSVTVNDSIWNIFLEQKVVGKVSLTKKTKQYTDGLETSCICAWLKRVYTGYQHPLFIAHLEGEVVPPLFQHGRSANMTWTPVLKLSNLMSYDVASF